MKKTLLLIVALSVCAATMAQLRPTFTKSQNSNVKAVRQTVKHDGTFIGVQNPNTTVASKSTLEDPSTMQTKYDLQSNGGVQNRIYRHADGTISATGTWAMTDAFSDRGTGYNYFNGTAWGAAPTARTESVRTGWPSIAPLGANGEITVSHQSGTKPLVVMKRATKGTGAWTETTLDPPAGASGLLWPRMVTSGTDHNTVHVICLTAPSANGGTVYNGLDGALIYTRSTDGGVTWEAWRQLDGLTSTNYKAFGGDGYAFAEPVGNTIAFTYCDSWIDFGLMKSTDNGATWTRTLVWENPWTLWGGTTVTDTFYTTDGCPAAAIDPSGDVHVVAGMQRANGDDAGGKFYYPFTDGLLYWNEGMPAWDDVLDPDVLFANGNYIGWVLDTMVFYNQSTELAHYGNGLSSFPSMVIDDQNHIFVVWSGVTNIKDANSYMYRHTFARASIDGGASWRDTIVALNTDFLYNFLEAVYPSVAANSTDKLQIIVQTDPEAGVYLNGSQGQQGQSSITTNDISFLQPTKASIIVPGVGINENKEQNVMAMVYPNPVKSAARFNIVAKQAGNLTLEITNLLGQQVMNVNKGYVNAGPTQVSIDASQLNAGVYVYKVKVNGNTFTGKMIVE